MTKRFKLYDLQTIILDILAVWIDQIPLWIREYYDKMVDYVPPSI